MEKLLELDQIVLFPSSTNGGHIDSSKLNFTVTDSADQSGFPTSLPIFTSPMEAIVGEDVAKNFVDNGIKPILPLTDPIERRLDMCKWIFCAFSMREINEYFIKQNQKFRSIQSQFHICIDAGNGHDTNLIQLGPSLRRIYGAQVILMAGNVGCPETYSDYSRNGFDYMRVGMSSGSIVDRDKYGFYHPMASLLESIKQYKRTSGVGLTKQVKVIADGGIETPSDIIKALALGADYVMCGKLFASVLESNGPIYKKSKNDKLEEVDPRTLQGIDGFRLREEKLKRQYHGNTSPENRASIAGFKDIESWRKTNPRIKVDDTAWIWVEVNKTLSEWVEEFRQCAYYAFMMTGSTNWEGFKKTIRYASV